MIVGIGIDTVEVKRFAQWHTKKHLQLSRLFSQEEIAHCLSCTIKTDQRFAAAFAVREAFFKTLWPIIKKPVPFLTLCRATCLISNPYPTLSISWDMLPMLIMPATSLRAHCSISHTETLVTALVVLETI